MSVFTSLASESPFLPSHPGLVSSCWTGIHLPIVSLFCVWNPAVSVIRSQYSSVPVWIHFSSHPLAPGKRLPTWSPICAAWPVAPRFYSIVFAACGWLAPCKDHRVLILEIHTSLHTAERTLLMWGIKDLRWEGHPERSKWSRFNHKGLPKETGGSEERGERQSRRRGCTARSQGEGETEWRWAARPVGGRGPEPTRAGGPRKLAKARQKVLP